jgi:hypothetical protein
MRLRKNQPEAKLEYSFIRQQTQGSIVVPLKSCLSTADLCDVKGESSKIKKSVSFHRIEIREHERALGDNPAVSKGPALSIGWGSVNALSLNVDEYEEFRPPRRTRSELQMPPTVRRQLLVEQVGVNRSEINAASREAERIKQSRLRNQKSKDIQPLVILSDLLLGKQKKTRKIARALLEQGQRADEARRQQQEEVNRMWKLQKEIEEACYNHRLEKIKDLRDRELQICIERIRIEQNDEKQLPVDPQSSSFSAQHQEYNQLERQSSFLPDSKPSKEDNWEF